MSKRPGGSSRGPTPWLTLEHVEADVLGRGGRGAGVEERERGGMGRHALHAQQPQRHHEAVEGLGTTVHTLQHLVNTNRIYAILPVMKASRNGVRHCREGFTRFHSAYGCPTLYATPGQLMLSTGISHLSACEELVWVECVVGADEWRGGINMPMCEGFVCSTGSNTIAVHRTSARAKSLCG
jgi:hypothetical protein